MISARSSLRWRVAIAFTVLGGVLSVLFAAATVYITEGYEHILVDEILRGQAEDYSLRFAAHPDLSLPQTHRLSGYLRGTDGSGDVPDDLLALGPGIHEHETNDEDGIHIGVFDTERGRLYFVIDLSDIEQLERYLTTFLAAVVLLGTSLSGWLGWMLAGTTIAPVRKLAAEVDALPTQPRRTDLAADLGPDELGRLAQAIDGYQARLVDAEAAEHAFFADASHELRTPVAVLQGAVELLLDEPATDSPSRRRLQRLDRGVRELTELIEVLFGLVRRRETHLAAVEAEDLLRACTSQWSGMTDPSRLRFDVQAEGTLHVPHREALLVLQGVIRRMLPPDPEGRLSLRIQDNRLDLEYGAGADSAVPLERVDSSRSDRGLGLTLVGRLAERIGWRIEELSAEPTHRRVRITWPNADSLVEEPLPR